MSAKKVYIDPVDEKQFTTRKLAREHMLKHGHKGGVIVKEIEVEKKDTKKTSTKSYKGKGGKKKTATRKKMEEAYELYLKYSGEGKGAAAIMKKIAKDLGEREGKIKGWIGTMKGESRRNATKGVKVADKKEKKEEKKEEKEEPEEEAPPPVYQVWVKILPSISQRIAPLIEGVDEMEIITIEDNGSHILTFPSNVMNDYDWLMFKHNFTSLPMENSDVSFIINNYFAPQIEMKIWDLAQKKSYGISDMSDMGCFIVDLDSKNTLEASVAMGRYMDINPQDLACVNGSWEEPKKVWKRYETPIVKDEKTEKEDKEKPIQSTFEDWDWEDEQRYYWYGSEEEDWRGVGSHRSGHLGGRHGHYTQTSYNRPSQTKVYGEYVMEPVDEIKYPVYRIAAYLDDDNNTAFIVTDRAYSFESYE